MSSGARSARILLTWFLVFLLVFLLVCFHVGCLLETKNHMGCLLRQYRCPLAMRLASEKGSRVARPHREKVPTRGFSAKKEGVWHDLRTKGANSRIFSEKGNCVARPPCHFPAKSADSWIFGKKETVWHDLKKSAKYSLFLCVPAKIK